MYKSIPLIFILAFTTFSKPLQAQYYGVNDKPAGSWKAGLQMGYSQLQGDVSPDGFGFHGGLFVQKNLRRGIDFRAQIKGGRTKGLNLEPSQGFLYNTAWNGWQDTVHFYDSGQFVYHNYQLQFFDLSLLFKLNLNQLFSPSGGENWDLYILGGVGVQLYQTEINMYNENSGTTYDFSSITPGTTETYTQLKELTDGTYETPAHIDLVNSRRLGNYTVNTSFSLGGGFSYSLTERIGLGLEGIYTFAGDDLLDGHQWLESNELSPDRDKLFCISLLFLIHF